MEGTVKRRAALTVVAAAAFLIPRAAAPHGPGALDDKIFRAQVRPMLARLGCSSGACHGSGLLPLRLGFDPATDFGEVSRAVVPGASARSLLLAKAFGRDHFGGQNLDEKSCESRLLAAWIDHRTHPGCATRTIPTADRPLDEALRPLLARCATAGCHLDRAAPRLLPANHPGALIVAGAALARFGSPQRPAHSPLLRALTGERHPRFLSGPDEPDYRRLYGWLDGEVIPPLPLAADFARVVQPVIERRGCSSNSCHGGGAGGLYLLSGGDSATDNALRLATRAASGDFPQKPLGDLPHGGGRRLGAHGDCSHDRIRAWLDARPAPTCPPILPPDRTRFATAVQPSLEALTCPRCHIESLAGFQFFAHPSAAQLDLNYQNVVAHIDSEFPPASPVLLRVREPCMQSRLLAWVANQPDPNCIVRLANFKGSFPSMSR